MLPADNGTAYEHLPSVLHVPTATGSMLTLQHVLFRTIEPQTYPYTSELFVAVPFFFMWVLIRKLLFKTVLLKSARLMGAPDELTEYKWAVLAWNGLFHVWSTLWLLSWLPLHRWYWDTRYLWENILAEQPQKLELEFKCFYMLQLGYHMQSIVWHFFEEHRPDFVTMMVHHVVTVLLIVFSYAYSYARIGMLVLLVHDSSDVFVCLCKCFHMTNWKKCSHACFVIMVIIWFYARLYLYPVWIISSIFQYPVLYGFNFWFFGGLMTILLVLHIWWFHLFMKIAYGIFQHGSGKDLTETKEAIEDRMRQKKNDDAELGGSMRKDVEV